MIWRLENNPHVNLASIYHFLWFGSDFAKEFKSPLSSIKQIAGSHEIKKLRGEGNP